MSNPELDKSAARSRAVFGAVSPAGFPGRASCRGVAGKGRFRQGDTSDIAGEVRNVLWPVGPSRERGVILGCIFGS